jgi:hypothetical protein
MRQALSSSRALSTKGFPAYVLNAPLTEVTTLGNGVRVASEVGVAAAVWGEGDGSATQASACCLALPVCGFFLPTRMYRPVDALQCVHGSLAGWCP